MRQKPLSALVALLLAVSASAQPMPHYKFSKSDGGADDTGPRDAAKDVVKEQGDFLSAKYGGADKVPAARTKELQERSDGLDGCAAVAADPKDNPDCGSSAWTCTGAMYDTMTFGKGNTDRSANAGLIRYARQSVMGDPVLYHSAFLFYKSLKEKADLSDGAPAPGAGEGASIDRMAATDLFKKALAAAKEASGKADPYLAMKTLVLFGHDNRFNYLSVGDKSNACPLKVLDAMKPNANSNLYLNNAIGMEYYSDDVEAAKRIHRECKEAASKRTVENDMCGEYSDYQADYYHVIVSAFLHCHCLAQGSSVIDDMAGGLQKDGYLFMVAKYKIDRFREELDAALKNSGHTPAVALLDAAFKSKFGLGANGWDVTCSSAKASTCLEKQNVDAWPWKTWCSDPSMQGACRDEDITVAKALAKRFVFEVNFRVSQHFQGIMAAGAYCRGSSLEHGACPQ
jgi:hypothetical protein